jgi:hypothetical protein
MVVRLGTLLVSLLVIAAALGAAADGGVPVMPLSEVGVGDRGVCLTEMDRGELVEIPLEVLGTMGGSAPEGEIVLVRLLDERFERTGIISGMSGSPVYIDGRLLGALAYGWSFSKDPIGGVTPFERMVHLSETAPSAASAATRRPGPGRLLEAIQGGSLGDQLLDWLVPEGGGDLTHLPLATILGGPRPTVGGWLARAWRRLGWVSAPAGGAAAVGDGALAPGDMVAGTIVSGDATVAVGGTVTEVRGDEVWAFGHPFLGAGSLVMPLARARVTAVLPSQVSSFKFFSVGEVLGAFRSDRGHGVWGRLGATAPSVPIQVRADDRSYRFDCVRHPVLSPLMVAYLTSASHAARGRTFGDQTVAARMGLDFVDGRRVEVEETFAGSDAPASAASYLAAVAAYLMNSSFSSPELASASVELTSEEALERAVIVDAVPLRTIVAPGETLSVRVRLRPHDLPEITRVVQVEIPSGLADGPLDLIVADGASWTAYDFQMRPSTPASFADELRFVARLRPSTRLVLAFERRDLGVAMGGENVVVPPSVLLTLRAGLAANLDSTSQQVVSLMEEPMTSSVLGGERIRLEVRQDRGAAGTATGRAEDG